MTIACALFRRTKDGRDKARMLVPAWLVGTVMGKNAQNIIAANAETGALMRFAPAGEPSPSGCNPAIDAAPAPAFGFRAPPSSVLRARHDPFIPILPVALTGRDRIPYQTCSVPWSSCCRRASRQHGPASAMLMLYWPRAADDAERDRLLEIVAPDVGTLSRAATEVMRLCLRNPRCALCTRGSQHSPPNNGQPRA